MLVCCYDWWFVCGLFVIGTCGLWYLCLLFSCFLGGFGVGYLLLGLVVWFGLVVLPQCVRMIVFVALEFWFSYGWFDLAACCGLACLFICVCCLSVVWLWLCVLVYFIMPLLLHRFAVYFFVLFDLIGFCVF